MLSLWRKIPPESPFIIFYLQNTSKTYVQRPHFVTSLHVGATDCKNSKEMGVPMLGTGGITCTALFSKNGSVFASWSTQCTHTFSFSFKLPEIQQETICEGFCKKHARNRTITRQLLRNLVQSTTFSAASFSGLFEHPSATFGLHCCSQPLPE